MTTTGAGLRRRRSHLSNGARTAVGCGRFTVVGTSRVAPADSSGFPPEVSTEHVRRVPADSTHTTHVTLTMTHARQALSEKAMTNANGSAHPPPAFNTDTPTPTRVTRTTTARLTSTSTSTSCVMPITRRPTPATPVSISTATTLATTTTRRPTPVTRVRCYRAMTIALTQQARRLKPRRHRIRLLRCPLP